MSKVVIKYQESGNSRMKCVLLRYVPALTADDGTRIENEFLNMEIYNRPTSKRQREHNSFVKETAELIRCERFKQIVRKDFSFLPKDSLDGDFISYFRDNTDYRGIKYVSSRIHFERFCHGKCSFREVTASMCIKFRNFLLNDSTGRRKRKLSQNSASAYFGCFIEIARLAYKDNILSADPTIGIDPIPWERTTPKSYLSASEIERLRRTPYPLNDNVRKAGLFSIDTGLRRGDILGLRWENFDFSDPRKPLLVLRMHKTGLETRIPLSRNALKDISPIQSCGMVFARLTAYDLTRHTGDWMSAAHIHKHITFHCFRTTFAMRLLEKGTDIYTIAHLLGHKNVASTQIYARVTPKMAMDAINSLD